MTILEKINEAETKAEAIKQKARQEVSEMLDELNHTNNQKVKQMMDDAKSQVARMYDDNEKIIKNLTEISNQECNQINTYNQQLAALHLNETIDFIMKKVIDSWL